MILSLNKINDLNFYLKNVHIAEDLATNLVKNIAGILKTHYYNLHKSVCLQKQSSYGRLMFWSQNLLTDYDYMNRNLILDWHIIRN